MSLEQIADRLEQLPAAVTPRAADAVERIAEDVGRMATGDGRAPGMGRRGPRLRAVSRLAGSGPDTRATIRGVPAGGWAILEDGSRAHVIAPARRAGVLMGPGLHHPVRGPVRHPGHRGGHAWTRVADAAAELVPAMFTDAAAEVLR